MSRFFLAFFLALSLHLLLGVLPWPQEKPPLMQPADNRSITVNLSQASAVVKKSAPPQMVTPTPIIPGRAVPVAKPLQHFPPKKTPERLQSRTKKRLMAQQAAAPPTPSPVAAKTPTRAAAVPPATQATTKEIPQARPEVTPGPSPSIKKARPLYDQNPKPAYPALAQRRGWQGVVILAVTVLADGSPGQLAIHTSSGHDLLDKTALQTVKDWHFLPGTKNNIAAAMEVLVPVQFVLQ